MGTYPGQPAISARRRCCRGSEIDLLRPPRAPVTNIARLEHDFSAKDIAGPRRLKPWSSVGICGGVEDVVLCPASGRMRRAVIVGPPVGHNPGLDAAHSIPGRHLGRRCRANALGVDTNETAKEGRERVPVCGAGAARHPAHHVHADAAVPAGARRTGEWQRRHVDVCIGRRRAPDCVLSSCELLAPPVWRRCRSGPRSSVSAPARAPASAADCAWLRATHMAP